MKTINEITMIDAGCDVVATGKGVFISINNDDRFIISGDEPAHPIAKITAHKQFVIMDPSFQWAVPPAKIREIHMNRSIQPWPREYKIN